MLRVAALAILVACAAACSRSAARESTPAIRLSTSGTGQAYIEVVGLSDSTLDRLADARYSAPEWSSLLRVSVDDASPPVVGRYEVTAQALRFTPLFPFDGGRSYQVRFDQARVDGEAAAHVAPLTATVGLPASTAVPSTVVTHVYPERRRPAGKPAADVHRVLGADGTTKRHRARGAARRARQRGGRAVPAARLRVLERRSDAVHACSSIPAASRTAFCPTSRWDQRSRLAGPTRCSFARTGRIQTGCR